MSPMFEASSDGVDQLDGDGKRSQVPLLRQSRPECPSPVSGVPGIVRVVVTVGYRGEPQRVHQ